MKQVKWEDERGYRHVSLVRDDDPEEKAPMGIPQGPPPLDNLDWDGIKRDLHNALVDAGLFSWRDVQESGGLRGAILSVLRKRLIYLYREADNG